MIVSVILKTATRYLIPLMLVFSFFLLLRGHNEPGGGFVGGLVAASAYALFAIANGVKPTQQMLRVKPLSLIVSGLLIAVLSGFAGIVYYGVFMKAFWFETKFPVIGKIGTPLIFDMGVYLLVLGISLKIIFSLFEEDEQ
ncbi:MAG: Na+/H+ antiporter subunit B [Melioribacteraceae bacterium]|nr:Na+/H+ antiporter subunit B [Melioribacteraceae bacterium]